MRLTDIMFKKLPNGHIWKGKHRLVRKVTPIALDKLRLDYEREEENMLILRHPYLTVEQSFGHMKALGRPRPNFEAANIEKFSKVTTLEDRLMHLRVRDSWE